MSGTSFSELPPPLIERSCGECNVCCYALTIDEPKLAKVQGVACQHTKKDKSCRIYGTRPDTCRQFWCGWRLFRWVRESLRPDNSGVLIRAQSRVGPNGTQPGVIFSLLTAWSMESEGLLESIAAAIAGGLMVYLHVPGPAGYTSSIARIDEAFAEVVRARDKAGMMAMLVETVKEGTNNRQLKKIVLKHAPKEGDDPETVH